MKKMIKIFAGSLVLLLAAIQAGAQNQAVPEVKAIQPDKKLQSAGRNSTVTEIKIPAGPLAPSLQKSETPPAVAVTAPVYPAGDASKPIEIGANKYKEVELKAYPKPQVPAPVIQDPRLSNPLPVKESAPLIKEPTRS